MRLKFLTSSYYHRYCGKVPSLNFLITPLKPGPSSTPRWAHMDSTTKTSATRRLQYRHNQKIVVIMGPTGSGKTKLSVSLATRYFPPSEIINSDKIQVYHGLDTTTNKIPMCQRLGVPHHLLGEVDHSDFTPSDFRSVAASRIASITSRRHLPLIVGGSNSFIYALLAKRFNPESDVFNESHPDPVCTELRYNCCFLWVDVSLPVLNQYLKKRVDEMLDSGMFEELAEFFDSGELSRSGSETRTGLRKAIGVPEFEKYFRMFPPGDGGTGRKMGTNPDEDVMRRVLYEEAVRAIKENTCQLAKRQVGKILRLRDAGWDLRRVDATEAFRAAMGLVGPDSGGWSDIWERQVVEPSVKIVKRFLEE